MAKCDVLLACYNSSEFLGEQLDSLLDQDCSDFRLIARDDGSTDGTPEILRRYQAKFDGRMTILEGGAATGSAIGNFSILLEASDADYVICADHDDVWFQSKVRRTIEMLEAAERDSGSSTPHYVFTDVIPVDRDKREISDSFWTYKKIDPAIINHLSQCLVLHPMLGCASGMNRALVRLILPIPPTMMGHDWWALMIALLFGKVRYSDEKTMLYRLHGGNFSMQKRVSFTEYVKTKNPFGYVRHGLRRRIDQADALLEVFGGRLRPTDRATLQAFSNLKRQGYLAKRLSAIRGNYLYPDWVRNAAMLIGM